MIELQGITKVYRTGSQSLEALRGVSMKVEPGEFISIMGPSGSGKSTLMNVIGCLDTPTAGEYLLDGRRVAGLSFDQLAAVRNRKIGFVFQNFNLLPYATAWENIELPMLFDGKGGRARKSRD
jgi:putative ABC transport system ATP-binding protein